MGANALKSYLQNWDLLRLKHNLKGLLDQNVNNSNTIHLVLMFIAQKMTHLRCDHQKLAPMERASMYIDEKKLTQDMLELSTNYSSIVMKDSLDGLRHLPTDIVKCLVDFMYDSKATVEKSSATSYFNAKKTSDVKITKRKVRSRSSATKDTSETEPEIETAASAFQD